MNPRLTQCRSGHTRRSDNTRVYVHPKDGYTRLICRDCETRRTQTHRAKIAPRTALVGEHTGLPTWTQEADELRENPGEWRMLTDRETNSRAYTMANQINRGVLFSFRPAGDFEAERRGTQVWARYLGDGELPDEPED
jgi:hypothetical protein